MTTKLYLHIIEETCIAQNHTFISKFLQVLLRYLTKTWKSGVFTPVYPIYLFLHFIFKQKFVVRLVYACKEWIDKMALITKPEF